MNINLTFLGQMIAFGAFVWFCMKYVWPPLLGALEERKGKIQESLHAADKAKQDLQILESTAQKTKEEAKKEAAKIVEQARQQAQHLVDSAMQKAMQEAERVRASTQEDIANQYQQKQEEIKQQIKEVAGLLVAKVVNEQFAKDTQLDENFITKQLSEMQR